MIIYSERLLLFLYIVLKCFNPQSVALIWAVFDLRRQKKNKNKLSLILPSSSQKQILMTNFNQLAEFSDRGEDFYRGPVKA